LALSGKNAAPVPKQTELQLDENGLPDCDKFLADFEVGVNPRNLINRDLRPVGVTQKGLGGCSVSGLGFSKKAPRPYEKWDYQP